MAILTTAPTDEDPDSDRIKLFDAQRERDIHKRQLELQQVAHLKRVRDVEEERDQAREDVRVITINAQEKERQMLEAAAHLQNQVAQLRKENAELAERTANSDLTTVLRHNVTLKSKIVSLEGQLASALSQYEMIPDADLEELRTMTFK